KVAAYVGGFLVAIAGVIQLAGHVKTSLWFLCVAVLFGIVAAVAFWRERFRQETTRFPWLLFSCAAIPVVLLFGYAHANLAEEQRLAAEAAQAEKNFKSNIQSQVQNLGNELGKTN